LGVSARYRREYPEDARRATISSSKIHQMFGKGLNKIVLEGLLEGTAMNAGLLLQIAGVEEDEKEVRMAKSHMRVSRRGREREIRDCDDMVVHCGGGRVRTRMI
jgi:hypothetical protein